MSNRRKSSFSKMVVNQDNQDRISLPPKDVEIGELTLWYVKGQASNESSGGEEDLYILSDRSDRFPDPYAAIEEAHPQSSFYLVDEMRRIATGHGMAMPNVLHDDCVNQLSGSLPQGAVNAIASLLLEIGRMGEQYTALWYKFQEAEKKAASRGGDQK